MAVLPVVCSGRARVIRRIGGGKRLLMRRGSGSELVLGGEEPHSIASSAAGEQRRWNWEAEPGT